MLEIILLLELLKLERIVHNLMISFTRPEHIKYKHKRTYWTLKMRPPRCLETSGMSASEAASYWSRTETYNTNTDCHKISFIIFLVLIKRTVESDPRRNTANTKACNLPLFWTSITPRSSASFRIYSCSASQHFLGPLIRWRQTARSLPLRLLRVPTGSAALAANQLSR